MLNLSPFVGGVGQDDTPACDEPEQFDQTLTIEKNVTSTDLEAETTQGQGFGRLHFECNSDVTDVTACNQEEEWDIWEGTNFDTGEPVPAPIDETECVRTAQLTQQPQQPAAPSVAPERNNTEASAANTPQPTSRPQPAPALAEAEVDAHAHTQPQQPVTAAAESTVPLPSVLAAQILQCQSWERAVEAMDIVSAAINKDRVVVYKSVLKHLSIDARQHLVRLLAAHIQQFPRDQWAYNWLPESSLKLKQKAFTVARGIKAGEESAND